MEIKTGYTSLNLPTSSPKKANGSEEESLLFGSLFSESLNQMTDEVEEENLSNGLNGSEDSNGSSEDESVEASDICYSQGYPFVLMASDTPLFMAETNGVEEVAEEIIQPVFNQLKGIESEGKHELLTGEESLIEEHYLMTQALEDNQSSEENLIHAFQLEKTSLKNKGEVEGEKIQNTINFELGEDEIKLPPVPVEEVFEMSKLENEVDLNDLEWKNLSSLNQEELFLEQEKTLFGEQVDLSSLKQEMGLFLGGEDRISSVETSVELIDHEINPLKEVEIVSDVVYGVETSNQPITVGNTSVVKETFSNPIWLNQKEVFQELSVKSNLLKEGDSTRLTLKLYPKNLGLMQVELSLQNGILQGRIIVESGEVKSMMERAFQQQDWGMSQNLQISVDLESSSSQQFSFSQEKPQKEMESSFFNSYRKSKTYDSSIEEESVQSLNASSNHIRLML